MQNDTRTLIPFRVIKGGSNKLAVLDHSNLDSDLRERRTALAQSLDIAARWLSLPPDRREHIQRAITMEIQQAKRSGEKSLKYPRGDENPYSEVCFLTRYALLNPDSKTIVIHHIIEEERRCGQAPGAWYVEQWTDDLLINESYPYPK